jgi:hypothetical protein
MAVSTINFPTENQSVGFGPLARSLGCQEISLFDLKSVLRQGVLINLNVYVKRAPFRRCGAEDGLACKNAQAPNLDRLNWRCHWHSPYQPHISIPVSGVACQMLAPSPNLVMVLDV